MRRASMRLALAASLTLSVVAVPGTSALAAQQAAAEEELRRALEALRAELAELRSQASSEPRFAELERRIDLLAAEIETLRTAGATEAPPTVGAKGFAPAAAKVYGVSRGVSVGGYGEAVYENFSRERQDGAAAGKTDQFDFLRQILYVGYKFNDEILFNSEIEFEHASTGKTGEASVEFAYVDYAPGRVGVRAGMLLVPMGFLNELHEPPIFHGARRPDVEQAVIPSTWRENGGGLFGEAGPFQWRAYVVSGLRSSGFSASGIRGGRQSGSRSLSEDFAFTGRLDYTGTPGLIVGGSFFTGEAGQGARVGTQELGAQLSLFEGHLQYEKRGFQLRALVARSKLDDAALVNAANNFTGNKSVGEAQYGWYVQGAFDLMTLGSSMRWGVVPFVRYEKLDTQDGVPAGFVEDPATERSVLAFGVGVKPIPQVVFKVDFAVHRNEARSGVDQFNLAVGYLF